MIVCINDNKQVLWLHDDDEVKQLPQYINDDNVFIVDKEIKFPTLPDEEYNYTYVWNDDTQDIELVQGKKIEVPHEEVTKQTYSTVEVSSYDNLTNMDMLIGIDEKLNMIMEHLGLIP